MPTPADIILDFIAQPESGGNYNAYYRKAKSTTPLITYSLALIYDFQTRMLQEQEVEGLKLRSTAVGYLQILKETLREGAAALNLPVTTIFSVETQRMLGMWLLERRGYVQWLAGTKPTQAFAFELSREWASMPDPFKSGASHYSNQKASRTLEQVYAMLDAAMAAPAHDPIIPAVEALAVALETVTIELKKIVTILQSR